MANIAEAPATTKRRRRIVLSRCVSITGITPKTLRLLASIISCAPVIDIPRSSVANASNNPKVNPAIAPPALMSLRFGLDGPFCGLRGVEDFELLALLADFQLSGGFRREFSVEKLRIMRLVHLVVPGQETQSPARAGGSNPPCFCNSQPISPSAPVPPCASQCPRQRP